MDITRNSIISALTDKGYTVEPQVTVKNGVEFDGIRFMNESNIAPVIYTEAIIKNAEEEHKSLEEVVNTLISIYESHKAFEFDVNKLSDKEFILNSIYIGLQRVSTEKLIKRACDFEGIESYLYIRGIAEDGNYSIKVSEDMLNKAEISEDEAWKSAEMNTNSETSLKSMAKVVSEITGIDYCEEMDEQSPFFVITNRCKIKGASAILNKKVLSDFGKRYNTKKIIVLPSSIHEMLVAPYTEEMDLDTFSKMVGEVNNTQVDPVDRLTDRAYIITL